MKLSQLVTLILPTLQGATASALVVPRQSQNSLVQVLSASVISSQDNIGCPPGHFSTKPGKEDNTLTLIYDKFTTYLYPANVSAQRAAFCAYEVKLRFPEGCTRGSIYANPGGTLRFDKRFSAKFKGTYTLSPGHVDKRPDEVEEKQENHPEGLYDDWQQPQDIGVQVDINPGGERVVKLTAETRIQLQSPGIDTKKEVGVFSIDHIDIGIYNMVKC